MTRALAVSRLARGLALLVALMVTGGLLVQTWASIETRGLGPAIWRLTSFFTILTNTLVAVVAWTLALGRTSGPAHPVIRLTTVNSIVLVGLIYVIALQSYDHPEGVSFYTNRVFHWLSPALFFIAWLATPHGGLRWKDALWAIVWPLGYCAYSMARGSIDGFYPYWFLDPARQSVGMFAVSFVILAATFAGFATLFVAIDRALAARGTI